MHHPLQRDPETARNLGVAIDLRLVTGEKLLTGLHDWNGEEGWFSVYYPQNLADTTSTRTIMLDQVRSWSVTYVAHVHGEADPSG